MNQALTQLAVVAFVFALPAMAEDAKRGKLLYESRCIACHSIDSHRVGPPHRGVFGRRAGVVPGYDYSDALRNARLVWSQGTLDRWLENPEKLIPGQKMGYAVSDASDRADLIAYLKQQSNSSQ